MISNNEERDSRNFFHRFFANPSVGIAGSLASIIGVVLAIYFYVQSTRSRELIYFIHPAKAIVVKTGQASRLLVTLDSKEIRSDITAAQIAFWNEGREAIKPENVLESFIIRTQPSVPIIESSIRKKSRDVVRIDLDQTRIDLGELKVTWNILEEGDGGIVQLIYAGSPETSISATAIIEGQRKIRELKFSGTLRSPTQQYSERDEWRSKMIILSIVFGIIMTGWGAFLLVRRRKMGRDIDAFAVIVFTGMPAMIIGMGLYLYIFYHTPGPPFGF